MKRPFRMKELRAIYCLFIFVFTLVSCNSSQPDEDALKIETYPSIFPDYNQVVVPPNIAPLNFNIEEKGSGFAVKVHGSGGTSISISSSASAIEIPIMKWKKILGENRGGQLTIDVSVKDSLNQWRTYYPLELTVVNEEIDGHLAYRLINVGYILWRKMGLYQRDLTSFKETPIMVNRNSDGNCMNCHSFSNNNPDRMMFHMRGDFGGTLISTPDSIFKIETKTGYTLASGAYPSWHPDGKHIAFSVNLVRQFFHGVEKRNEVYDMASDLVIYDIETNTITTNPSVSTLNREVLPNWSPDGKYLYFSRAPQFNDTINYNEVFYDLMRIGYDTQTNRWGKLDTILLASELNSTISFPKISPDGKYILFTQASHGYFTIYNTTSDLYFLNLETKEITEFPFNSGTTDSYHSWSGNSRWVVFSSKRLDGLTTRPFISYIDEHGKAHKPFVLPQKDPLFYRSFKTNYNVPELIKGAVDVDRLKLLEAVRGEAAPVLFDTTVNVDALSGATKLKKEESLH